MRIPYEKRKKVIERLTTPFGVLGHNEIDMNLPALDNLHKISTEIANQYDIVCAESLNMKAMSNKGFGNGKATLDNGYGIFLRLLEYKLANRGKHLVKVDKWFPSSQICHCCGTRHLEMKDLRLRTMKCGCGLTMSSDQNAAINIKKEGLRIYRSAETAS